MVMYLWSLEIRLIYIDYLIEMQLVSYWDQLLLEIIENLHKMISYFYLVVKLVIMTGKEWFNEIELKLDDGLINLLKYIKKHFVLENKEKNNSKMDLN